MKVGQPMRFDYEYERKGSCNLFMVFQPLVGWRQATVTARRTSIDFAYLLRDLVDVHFPEATCVRVVLDNLNTHSFAVEPPFQPTKRAASLVNWSFTTRRNMVEIELSVLVKQCLNRRIPDRDTLQREVTAWQNTRNAQHATVKWLFNVSDARTRLSRFYP
jgi:hypothetical protein